MKVEFKCRNCARVLSVDAEHSGGTIHCPGCNAVLLVPAPSIESGTQIAGFRIEEKVGSGGMGDVYRATQLSIGREVALKVLPPATVANPVHLQRFLREIEVTGKLDHPHIVTVHDAGEDSGVYYLAMAFVDGKSVDVRVADSGFIEEKESLRIVKTVAKALQYAWQKQHLLHRDIKPANVMITSEGEVKLLDLGLAKSLDSDLALTGTNLVVGTPYYMSPEQADPRMDVDSRSDQYSLGATFFEMVTGRRPYEGKSAKEILRQATQGPPPSAHDHNPQISEACSRVIQRMMAPQQKHRYAGWAEVVEATENVLQGRPEPAAPPTKMKMRTKMPGREAPEPEPEPAEPEPEPEPPPEEEPEQDSDLEQDLGLGIELPREETPTPQPMSLGGLPGALAEGGADHWDRAKIIRYAAAAVAISVVLGTIAFFLFNRNNGSPSLPEDTPETVEPVPVTPEPEPQIVEPPKKETVADIRRRVDAEIDAELKRQLQQKDTEKLICERLGLVPPVRGPAMSVNEVRQVIQQKLATAIAEVIPPDWEAKLEARANEKFKPFVEGDKLKLLLRGGLGYNPIAEGPYRGMEGSFVLVGSRRVAIGDLAKDDRVRFFPEQAEDAKRKFITFERVKTEDQKKYLLEEKTPEITAQVYRKARYMFINGRWVTELEIFKGALKREADRRREIMTIKEYEANGLVLVGTEWELSAGKSETQDNTPDTSP